MIAERVGRVLREDRDDVGGDEVIDAVFHHDRIGEAFGVQAEHGVRGVEVIETRDAQRAARLTVGLHEHDLVDAIGLQIRVAALDAAFDHVALADLRELGGDVACGLAQQHVVVIDAAAALARVHGIAERREHGVPALRECSAVRGDRGRRGDRREHGREVVVARLGRGAGVDHELRERLVEQRVERRIVERHAALRERIGRRRRQRTHVRVALAVRPHRDHRGDHAATATRARRARRSSSTGMRGMRARGSSAYAAATRSASTGTARPASDERRDLHDVRGRLAVGDELRVDHHAAELALREPARERIDAVERGPRRIFIVRGDAGGQRGEHVTGQHAGVCRSGPATSRK